MIEISLLWSSFALTNVSAIFMMTIIAQRKIGIRRMADDLEGFSAFSTKNIRVIRLPDPNDAHHNPTLKQWTFNCLQTQIQ